MFKKFTKKDNCASVAQVKSSVQRGIRNRILEEMPSIAPVIDDILPKKSPIYVAKCSNHINIVLVDNVPLFFNIRDGPYYPTLRLLHKCKKLKCDSLTLEDPFLLPTMQVDRGAVAFIMTGANIMCRGLTSPGAKMSDVGKDTVVAIMVEGKKHAIAVGITSMSSEEIAKVNSGIGILNIHHLNDGLWQYIDKFDD